MAKTGAERQKAHRERQAAELATLQAEVAELRGLLRSLDRRLTEVEDNHPPDPRRGASLVGPSPVRDVSGNEAFRRFLADQPPKPPRFENLSTLPTPPDVDNWDPA